MGNRYRKFHDDGDAPFIQKNYFYSGCGEDKKKPAWQIRDEKTERKDKAFDVWKIETNYVESIWLWINLAVLLVAISLIVFALNRFMYDQPKNGFFTLSFVLILFSIFIFGRIQEEKPNKSFEDNYVDIDPELNNWMKENI